jgi:hypothetical protein
MSARFKITADSQPVYDKWGFWEGEYWKCVEWTEWFYALKNKYGKNEARKMWSEGWNNQTELSNPIDCRSSNTIFQEFLKKEDLWDLAFEGVGGAIVKTGVGAKELAESVLEGAAGIVDAAAKTGKNLKYILPIVFVLALVGVGAYSYKTFVKGK